MKGVIVKHMVTRLTRRKERYGEIMTLADKGGRGGQANGDKEGGYTTQQISPALQSLLKSSLYFSLCIDKWPLLSCVVQHTSAVHYTVIQFQKSYSLHICIAFKTLM